MEELINLAVVERVLAALAVLLPLVGLAAGLGWGAAFAPQGGGHRLWLPGSRARAQSARFRRGGDHGAAAGQVLGCGDGGGPAGRDSGRGDAARGYPDDPGQ